MFRGTNLRLSLPPHKEARPVSPPCLDNSLSCEVDCHVACADRHAQKSHLNSSTTVSWFGESLHKGFSLASDAPAYSWTWSLTSCRRLLRSPTTSTNSYGTYPAPHSITSSPSRAVGMRLAAMLSNCDPCGRLILCFSRMLEQSFVLM